MLILFSVVLLFAEDTYSIKINNADSMETSSDSVVLKGNVDLIFITDGDKGKIERKLSCEEVFINLDNKTLQASGKVLLKEGEETSFYGNDILLNWDTLDVVIFGGKSSTIRKNNLGEDVEFFSKADRISHSSENNTTFFEDGVVSTREKDPNWSINAKEIGLFDEDMFFRSAWLKLGRVKLFYLPFFFYPGNRFSFNPSVGFSSSKGTFMNSTYELYGTYSPSASASGDTEISVLNFFKSTESSKKIRDGLLYKDLNYEELSDFQKWAYDSSSYFALFADSYETKGVALGFDTHNVLKNKGIVLDADAVIAKPVKNSSYKELRGAFDLSLKLERKKTTVNINIPYMTDPYVKQDFYNRNTGFALDSLFGTTQYFPTTYKSASQYYWTLDSNTSFDLGRTKITVRDLDSIIDFRYSTAEKKFIVKQATLPNISLSGSGTLVDWKTGSEEITIAEAETRNTEVAQIEGLKAYAVPLKGKQTRVKQGAQFRIDYSFNGYGKEIFSENFIKQQDGISSDGKVSIVGKLPDSWISVEETLSGSYARNSKVSNSTVSEEGKINSTMKISSQKVGLEYNLSNKLLSYSSDGLEDNLKKGEWNSSDVTSHSLKYTKKVGDYSLSVLSNLKPLVLKITPNVTYTKNGVSVNGGFSFNPETEDFIKNSTVNLDVSISLKNTLFKMQNKYDFSKEGLAGYSFTQDFSTNITDSKFSFAEKMESSGNLEVDKLQFFASYEENSITLNLSGPEISPDNLKVVLAYNHNPKYVWKNRIGFDCALDSSFVWDFRNNYASSLNFDFAMNFGIAEFLDMSFAAEIANTSFYKYFYDGEFDFDSLIQDLKNSVDFVGDGRYHTGFNISSLKFSLVHYMEDWTLNINAGAGIDEVEGKYTLKPEASFIIRWNVISELKVNENLEI